MSPLAERASPARAPLSASALALVLATFAPPSRAQAPSCAWGDGVTLPVSGSQQLLLASDGAAGVLAFTAPEQSFIPPNHGVLRMFHVLAQGKLDPALPGTGVSLLSGLDIPDHEQLTALRAIPDGTGGAYLLVQACDPEFSRTWKLRCYEVAQIRLLHVTAQGTPAPGWPALGHVFDSIEIGVEVVDIVPDGAGGVLAVWLDWSLAGAPIRAQRFAADGTTLWPGGTAGLPVLSSTYGHVALCIDGDGAGGVVTVAGRRANAIDNRIELIATRVDGSGNLAWGTSGVPVMQQPTLSVRPRAVTVDAEGRSFIAAVVSNLQGYNSQFYTQSLAAQGTRRWGLFGVAIGPSAGDPNAQLVLPSGFTTLHPDNSGVPHLQIQNETGFPQVADNEGLALDGMPWPKLLATEEGHMLLVWSTNQAPDPPDVRAIEFDEWANLSPGWPDTGVPICGGVAGHELADAFVGTGHLFVGLESTGWYGTPPMVQRLSREVLGTDDPLPARALELSPPNPNPARGPWSIEVALREAAHVTLDAYDVAGRRALGEDFGTLAPGRHPLAVPAGASLAPGVYRVRVRAGDHAAERTLIQVR